MSRTDCGLLRRRSSKLLIVSLPPRTCSILNKFSQCPTPSDEKECDAALLQVATKACRVQQHMGYFFSLDLSTTCRRWSDVELGNLLETDGVQMLEIDQCKYSSRPTRLLTNLSLAAVVLNFRVMMWKFWQTTTLLCLQHSLTPSVSSCPSYKR